MYNTYMYTHTLTDVHIHVHRSIYSMYIHRRTHTGRGEETNSKSSHKEFHIALLLLHGLASVSTQFDSRQHGHARDDRQHVTGIRD